MSCPSRSFPPGKTRYPLYRRLGGPQGWSGQVQKISPPPGFDPRTVQLVASHSTDYATRPTHVNLTVIKVEIMYSNHIYANPKQSCNKVHLVRKRYFVVNFTKLTHKTYQIHSYAFIFPTLASVIPKLFSHLPQCIFIRSIQCIGFAVAFKCCLPFVTDLMNE